ncbi:MAG TPA: Flp family type IVb pilin [Candidatus Krumholzibacteria bacterium]|nr:Flp family type IVb pilin [Candidatus Krumholzibacteria bacterium]
MSCNRTFLRDESGQDLTEYGLLAALISIAAVLIVKSIGPLVAALYQVIVAAIGLA